MIDPASTVVDWYHRVTALAREVEVDPRSPRAVEVSLDDLVDLVRAANYYHDCYVSVRTDLAVARAQAATRRRDDE